MFDLFKRLGPWYWFGWRVARTHMAIWHRIEPVDVHNMPITGGAIIASNHISHLDPPSVGCTTPRHMRFVAKEELFKQFFLSWYLPSIGVIPIRRGGGGRTMLEHAAVAVKNGDLVALFPEGTRSKTGGPGRPHTGVIVLAAMTDAPVIPVRISGTYDCMPPGSVLPGPGKIQVAFGEPIRWESGEIDTDNREQLVREVRKVMARIYELPGWHPKRAKASIDEIEEAIRAFRESESEKASSENS